MRNDQIVVNTQGVKGGKTHCNKQGYVRVTATKGYNEPEDSIVIDGFKGFGASYGQREDVLLSISFKDGTQWNGTFKELSEKLTQNPN